MSVAPLPRLVSALPAAKQDNIWWQPERLEQPFCWLIFIVTVVVVGHRVRLSHEPHWAGLYCIRTSTLERGHCVVGNDYAVPGLFCKKWHACVTGHYVVANGERHHLETILAAKGSDESHVSGRTMSERHHCALAGAWLSRKSIVRAFETPSKFLERERDGPIGNVSRSNWTRTPGGKRFIKQSACIQRTPDSKSIKLLLNPRLEGGRTPPHRTIEGLDAAAKQEAL